MPQSATPATQNDMTTCLETFEKERFWSFPRGHGEATGKPETRGSIKTSMSCETSSKFHSWKPPKRRGFAASPIDTAKPQENQRLEPRHVGASKRAFRARLPPILTLCSVFLRVFWGTWEFAISKSMFRARLPSIFQHISQNATPTTESAPCRHLTQPRQCDSQKTRNTTRLQCCACHENCNASSENVAKVLRLPHKTTFDTLQNTSECHKVPHLPRETKQRDVWNLEKDPFCRTYHRHGHIAIARTVANGCERLRTVALRT